MYDQKQSFKEVIRHVLFLCDKSEAIYWLRRWRGMSTRQMQAPDTADAFVRIYSDGLWVAQSGQDSLSGEGSTNDATSELVIELSGFLRQVKCRRLVDIGCGDFNWMRRVQSDFDYVGIDIVSQVIADNVRKYASDRRRFICADATRAIDESGDVALCREVLFHLSFEDGCALLRNIRAAGFKYVMLTNDISVWFNANICNGDYRRINLLKAPYRLPPPCTAFDDSKIFRGRSLGVWDAAALPENYSLLK